jgi:hypothetical protein
MKFNLWNFLRIPDDFMRHFRWITPLSLLLLNLLTAMILWAGKEFLSEFKGMKNDIGSLKTQVAKIEGVISVMRFK